MRILFALMMAAVVAMGGRAFAADAKGAWPDPAKEPVASWVWGADAPRNGEQVFFRKTLEIAPGSEVATAVLWAAGDNELAAIVNGQFIGASKDWKQPVLVNMRRQLLPGKNVVAIAVRNGDGIGGMIAKATIVLKDGRRIELASDDTWKYAQAQRQGWNTLAYNDADWPKVKVLGKYGMQPWGTVASAKPAQATPAEQLVVPAGFKAELLYSVPKLSEGSWVAMTNDPKGRLIVSDQDGGLFRVTVAATAAETKVEEVPVPLGHAQGLLWAFDSLYVTVNGRGVAIPKKNPNDPKEQQQYNSSGFYRVRDTNGDDVLDSVEKLTAFQGGGEHGPHAIRLGTDGKLYVVAGNFTKVTERLSPSSPHGNYAEDLVLPRNPDGGGHDPTIWAPGGWVARTDKDGKMWELVAAGLRNTYDIAFNPEGELFGYDSDMEWDTGTPWHRPIRVNLLVSGGEYGWRNGTGKWPEYYPDSLGAVVNTGLGSPTGVEFGTGARFPAKYQRALFIQDWSYGNVYAVHLTPEGAGYKGTFELFVSGKPFAVTDLVVNTDGNMYITIGGRGTQSGLYRIRYIGTEPTSPVGPMENVLAADARKIRHRLESFHGKQDAAAVSEAWQHLNSPDRYLRYAARVALEWQPIGEWKDKALSESRPTALTHAIIALVRAAAPVPEGAKLPVLGPTASPDVKRELLPKVLDSLGRLNLRTMTDEQVLEALRAYGLAFVRLGRPDDAAGKALGDKLDALYPTLSPLVNRELSQLLVYLRHPSVIAKSLKLMHAAMTQEDQLHYAFVIRTIEDGWTMEQRKAHFSFLAHAEKNYKGGASFKRFLQRIRQDAEARLLQKDKLALEPFLKGLDQVQAVKVLAPRQFVRNWQMQDLLPEIDKATSGRNFERGKAAYEAAQCAACHRFANEGGATGPDITGSGNRFSAADLLESILQPSKVVSDQYQLTEFVLKDDVIAGRVEAEDDVKVTVRTHPLAADTIEILKKDLKTRRPSKLSMMPEGLVDILTKEEILDLLAYLRSGGNPQDKVFAK